MIYPLDDRDVLTKIITYEVNMDPYNVKKVEEVLKCFDDGDLFELFAQEFLAAYLGKDFIPLGKMHDKGLDGLEHVLYSQSKQIKVYQVSIQKDGRAKVKDTINKLNANGIKFDELIYVTNKSFPDIDQYIEKTSDELGISLKIWDVRWLSTRVNSNDQTLSVYNNFINRSQVDNYFEEYFVKNDYSLDPRLFVFLRQQFEENRQDQSIEEIIADSIILYSLEDTDPDNGIVKNETEILSLVSDLVKNHPKQIDNTIKSRLKILSTKPRKIKYHSKFGGYVIPYETRIEIREKQLLDKGLHEHFRSVCSDLMISNLKDHDIVTPNPDSFVLSVINQLFYTQGLEFSNFIINLGGDDQKELNIDDIINSVVEKHNYKYNESVKIKNALLHTIRTIVYQGDTEVKEYLKRLSNTYLMMFLLQWDPHIARFFRDMAKNLEVYVCNSIIIPAISEIFLEENNRRHFNLLIGANKAGVHLIVNEFTVEEIVTHLQAIKRLYYEYYEPKEALYLDELQMLYIDEILIRSYYYAKIAGKVKSFNEFLDFFVNPNLQKTREEIVFWLRDKFGITYRPSANSGVQIDPDEVELLVKELTPLKKNQRLKAANDVKTMLTVFALREKNGELNDDGIFGYRTWWLSKDTNTYKVLHDHLGKKYSVSCYMRPDFLYQYITLAPAEESIKDSYEKLFPSLIGVNIGYHLPSEIGHFIKEKIDEFYQRDPTRVRMILTDLATRLRYDPDYRCKSTVEHFLDERLKQLAAEVA